MRIEVFERVFLGRESVGHNVMRSLAGKPDHKPIVGIKCSDGIVVGADGAATLGNLSQMTARQPVRNLFVVSNVMIVGISGSIGLSQFLIDSIRGLWDAGGLKSKHPVQGMGILRDTMRPHAVREIQAAAAVRGAIGDHAALQSAVCSTVIAVTLARSDCLFQFDHQAAPEAATEELPFLAIGSGQNIADPFLAFLRSIFWPKRLPVLSEGVLATLWSLSHAIETNPGVADPIQIMTLAGGVIHELDESELLEHRQAIDAAERSLVEFKEAMASGSSVPAS